MVQLSRLSIAGLLLVSALACNLAGELGPTARDVEATVDARVEATLTAERHLVAATHVTETVAAAETLSAQIAQASPLATILATSTPKVPVTEPLAEPGSAELASGPTLAPLMPVIAYFRCDPCVVEPGGSATLSWDLSGATAAYLDGHGITAPGSTVVYPDQTTTYRLVAVGADGRSEKTVTVEVRGLPTIHYFTCLPCEMTKGQQSTLSWDLSGATAAYLDGEGVPAPGSVVVAPNQTTTYRLMAVSERGSVERLVTVTVKEGGDPETVSDGLRRLGYDIRWVGHLPLAGRGDSISVIMAAITNDLQTQEVADQYFWGFKALYDNYDDQILSVGLYDGMRYIVFATAEPLTLEAFLRGEMDGQAFWQAVTWNRWDEWTGRWLKDEAPRRRDDADFVRQDFVSKSFGF